MWSSVVLFLLLYRASDGAPSQPIPLYMDKLLNAGRQAYDKQATPTQGQDVPTKVKLAMYIEGLSSFRTQTMDFQLDVYFQQFWRDSRLAHNETRRVLVRDQTILHKMWHPDIYFANARIAQFHQVTQPNFLIWIEPDGSILYDSRVSMIVMCMMNLAKWPLDEQRCHLRILSYAYDQDQLDIEWTTPEPITRNPNIAMSDMQIVDLQPGLCDGNYSTGVWSCVTAEFFVKREMTHHVMQSYVPTTLIVVISWFSFWLDVDAVPARVSLAITTLLTLSTQANAARMALPEVSYMKAIDVWMGTCMMFVFGVMIEFTCVNYAQRQGAASSVESMKEEKKENTANNNNDGSMNIGLRARDLIDKLRAKEHHQLVEEDMNAREAGEWRSREGERLANWARFDGLPQTMTSDDNTGKTSPASGLLKRHSTVWSKFAPNGTGQRGLPATTNELGATSGPQYGSTNDRSETTTTGEKGGDKWTSALKQIKTHKKNAGRREAKRIDQKSRWVFPFSFLLFNIGYWTYYLYIA